MAQVYLYEEIYEYLTEDKDSCQQDNEDDAEPVVVKDHLAEWRYIVDV